MKILSFLALALLLASSQAARAEDEGSFDLTQDSAPAASSSSSGGKPKVVYRKRTNVSFDDAVVEGASNNPEGVYVVTPPEKKFGSLLKLRPNFHRELMRDALLLK